VDAEGVEAEGAAGEGLGEDEHGGKLAL
jgi:hypothetical protein